MAYTTIDKPTDYFNTVLYTGNGTADRGITGVGFQPDWVWIKNRTDVSSHKIFDSVRGAGLEIETDTTDAEAGTLNAGKLPSFDSDGFTVSGSNTVNGSGDNMVAWNWYTGATASSNTDGSITSSVSANTTAGFSIVSYTSNGTSGATVGHGLGVAPKMVIAFNLAGEDNWGIGHNGLTSWDYYLQFGTHAQSNSQNVWNDTAPSSSVVTLGNNGRSNTINNRNYIMYCFAEKKGFSKFGSYTGNGNADGTFVYTGFKPAFVLVKRTDSADHWFIWDSKRSEFNQAQKYILPSSSNAESDSTSFAIDILSNGFKLRVSTININASGSNYIYMCFAENPFVTSTGIPTTAR